jgi:hypothetical protein
MDMDLNRKDYHAHSKNFKPYVAQNIKALTIKKS